MVPEAPLEKLEGMRNLTTMSKKRSPIWHYFIEVMQEVT